MTATKIEMPGAPAWSWLPEREIEGGAMMQIRNIAALPCATAVAVMPDAHQGYGMPIGCVLATANAVVPYAVGVDIGCGMVAARLPFSAADLAPHLRAVLDGIMARVPVGNPIGRDRNAGSFTERQNSESLRLWVVAEASPITPTHDREALRERADRQLGTLGGGNHFIELQADENGQAWLMLHTGSRSLGKAICDKYHAHAAKMTARWWTPLPDKDLAFISLDDDAGWDYMRDMRAAMDFATESRARIEAACLVAIVEVGLPATPEQRIETHHNFAAKEKHLGKWAIVHRKGAVATFVQSERPGSGGDPVGEIVTIPGSMQTGSYIARGRVEDPGVLLRSIRTCSHGAGRRLGRNETKRQNVGVDIRAEMEREGIMLVTPSGSDALDEAGRAYKDIENVMSYQAELVEPIVKLKPLGVVKG